MPNTEEENMRELYEDSIREEESRRLKEEIDHEEIFKAYADDPQHLTDVAWYIVTNPDLMEEIDRIRSRGIPIRSADRIKGHV